MTGGRSLIAGRSHAHHDDGSSVSPTIVLVATPTIPRCEASEGSLHSVPIATAMRSVFQAAW